MFAVIDMRMTPASEETMSSIGDFAHEWAGVLRRLRISSRVHSPFCCFGGSRPQVRIGPACQQDQPYQTRALLAGAQLSIFSVNNIVVIVQRQYSGQIFKCTV